MAGISANESGSTQDSTQGLSREGKTALEPGALRTAGVANTVAQEGGSSPFGYFQGSRIRDLLDVDPNTGLPRASTQYLGSVANQEMSKFSAAGSTRGQWAPENTPNIVGGALMGMAGQLIPMQTDYSKFMAELPDQLINSRLGYLNATTNANAALIGSQKTGESSAFGFGASYGGGSGGQQSSSGASTMFG